VIDKECQGMKLTHSFPVLDMIILEGDDASVFDTYFEKMDIKKPKAKPATGWTSWYNYYTNISEEIILKNLDAFAQKEAKIDFFQIDDGWQKDVGNWLSTKDNFPNGMGAVAQKIHAKGYKAGLWLAPFICEKKSDIFQNKKHWLLKDTNGKPVKAGYSSGWSGHFYALDFYNNEVQDYLIKVFFKILSTWNFDLVKLDFLYAVCILPRPNKTRGQVMNDALQFIRHLVSNKLILGCGVPLGSSFGLVDYCRIGADIHLEWEHKLLKFLGNRERVSTILSLRTTLGRWQLNGRAFLNDPDVFLLRDENLRLTEAQKHTVLMINVLLGGLLFTSDFVGDYSDKKWAEFNHIFEYQNAGVKTVKNQGRDLYEIDFIKDGQRMTAFCNLNENQRLVIFQDKKLTLQPFETQLLME
jgi:alpha-galactosidase